jgi:hypothetical protein
MQRFRRLIAEHRKGASPWASPSGATIDAIAAGLEASDVGDIIDALDQLTQEKFALPAWDGDSQDDVAHAQELYANILSRLAVVHGAAIAARLDGVEPLTARYLNHALGRT